jgi:hypothetical protein
MRTQSTVSAIWQSLQQTRSDCPAHFRKLPSAALEVGHQALTGFDQLVRLDAEHVVPRSGGRPHLVVLQQVGVDEHAQVGRVAERGHATDGLCSPSTPMTLSHPLRRLVA